MLRDKVHLNLIMIIIIILMIVIPSYSHAVTASEVLEADLSKQSMSTLKDWHKQVNSRI